MRRSAAVLVLASVLVAACSDSSDTAPGSLPPVAQSTGSPSASASAAGGSSPRGSAEPSPRASLPPIVRPPAADERTRQGAAAFTRYWYAELDRAYAALDNTRLIELSDPTCKTCANYIGDIEAAKTDGRRFEGGTMEVVAAEVPPLVNDIPVVEMIVNRAAVRVFFRDGTLKRSFSGITGRPMRFQVRWDEGAWRALRVVEPRS